MYSFIRALGILKESDGKPRHLDLATIPLNQLYSNYWNVEIIVIDTTQPTQELQLDLEQLPNGLRFVQQTLVEWLVLNGNNTLPTKVIESEDQLACVHYYNLWQRDFSVQRANINFDPQNPISEEERKDILVTRTGADYTRLYKNGLGTVDGFVHRLDSNDHGLWIVEGGRVKDATHVGYLDFRKVGNIEIVPITPAQVFKRSEQDHLKDGLYIKLDKPLVGKTPLLVIGGWLHALDDTYKVVGDSVIKFDFANYPFFKRLVLTSNHLNLDTLGNLKLSQGQWHRDLVFSDDTIRKWFTLPQSFIILVDQPELVVGRQLLESPQLTGRYYSNDFDHLPLIVGDQLTEYKHTDEKIGWVINPLVYLQDQLVIEESGYLENQCLQYRRRSDLPVKIPSAHWLRIGKIVEGV